MREAKSTIFFKTYGCRLNQAETATLKSQALELGFFISGEDSDVIVINSCSVTDNAQKELEGFLKKQKKRYPDQLIYLIGCGAKNKLAGYATILDNKTKEGIFERPEFPRLKNRALAKEGIARTRINYKIQDGCNNFCSYCIVPFLRGRERSISDKKIIQDLKLLEESGAKEVVLTGVNIGKYRYRKTDLALLIKGILDNTAIERIRLSSINPEDLGETMIELWENNARLCRHFHISLQSGSDAVLDRMKRHYSSDFYRHKIQGIRRRLPEVIVTTDVIVGFPGESEVEFEETLAFVSEMKFYKLHIFRYSKREGTVAKKMKDQIPESIKKSRAKRISDIDRASRKEIQKKYIGKIVEILVENKKNGYYSGHTENYIKVNIDSEERLANQMLRVKIERLDNLGLWAQTVE